MRQLRHLVILGISTYLLVLLITFPASVALRWFAPDDFAYISVMGGEPACGRKQHPGSV